MTSHAIRPGTSRIEAFSDGVIAIVLTIMVLDLRPPGTTMDHDSLAALIDYLSPKLIVYAMSFAIVAKLWVSHHQLMHAASHATTWLMWLNNLLLFFMSLIPFATGYLSEDPGRPLAVATYGAVLSLNGLMFTLMRHYVVTHLLREGLAKHRQLVPLSIAATVLYALGAAAAYLSIYLSFALFVLVPLLSMHGDRNWRLASATAQGGGKAEP